MAVIHLWRHFVALMALVTAGAMTTTVFLTHKVTTSPVYWLNVIVWVLGASCVPHLGFFLFVYFNGLILDKADTINPTRPFTVLVMPLLPFLWSLAVATILYTLYGVHVIVMLGAGLWEPKAMDLAVNGATVLFFQSVHLFVATYTTQAGRIVRPSAQDDPSTVNPENNYNLA